MLFDLQLIVIKILFESAKCLIFKDNFAYFLYLMNNFPIM